MPEGDTIHAVANALGPALIGQRTALVELMQHAVPWGEGARVEACEAVGKHLVLTLSTRLGPRVVRVHLGMKGSWHRYRPGETWQRAPARRRCVIVTADWVFVCFDAKDVEVTTQVALDHLGPDLLGDTFDVAAVVARARRAERERPGLALGELVMLQTVACGIGNVYKSEVLFLEARDPWRAVASVDDAALTAVYARARALMALNLARGGWRITTTAQGHRAKSLRAERTWVYRRAGRPCRRCGAAIASRLQGALARMTYWCPGCQS